MLRTLFPALVLMLAACELQPAPPPSASRSPSTPQAGSAVPTEPSQAAPPALPQPPPPQPQPQAPADAGVRPPPSEPCMAIGQHVATILIAEAPPAQQMAFEQDRDKIARSTADACTAQAWSADALKCYAVANTGVALKQCETRFRPSPTPDAAPQRGGQPAFEAGGEGSASAGKKTEPGAPKAETPAKGKATARTRSDRPATP